MTKRVTGSSDFSAFSILFQDPFERALLERRMEDSVDFPAILWLRPLHSSLLQAKRQILDEKEQMDAEALWQEMQKLLLHSLLTEELDFYITRQTSLVDQGIHFKNWESHFHPH